MPHLAAAIIRSWLPADTEVAAKAFRLLPAHVRSLTDELRQDALGLHYSALISFIDAINGIRFGHFSWTIVKLYYTCFYAARVLLATNRCAIFYVTEGQRTGKPFSIVIRDGNAPHRENGVTHKIVWTVLERELPNHALLQRIGINKAHEWMKDLREEVNYREPRFMEPLVPPHFSQLSILGVATASTAYVNDQSLLYALDPDHAALAFPIECLKRVLHSMSLDQNLISADDRTYLNDTMIRAGLPEAVILTQLPHHNQKYNGKSVTWKADFDLGTTQFDQRGDRRAGSVLSGVVPRANPPGSRLACIAA